MGNNLIKVLNPKKAEELSALGFKYSTEKCGDNNVLYAFFNSKELMSYINKNFDKKDFVLSNRLNF